MSKKTIQLETARARFIEHATNLDQKTRASYDSDLKRLVAHFGAKKSVKDISENDLRIYLNNLSRESYQGRNRKFVGDHASKKLSAVTINRHRISIRRLFAWLKKERHIESDPGQYLEKISTDEHGQLETRFTTARPLTDEQIEKILEHAENSTERLFYLILSTSAIRTREATLIQVDDIDFKTKILKSSSQYGFILPKLEKALKDYLKKLDSSSPWLFPSPRFRGKPVSYHSFQKALKNIVTAYNIYHEDGSQIVLNDLRETAIVNLVRKLGVETASKILNLKIDSVARYDEPEELSLKKAYKMLLADNEEHYSTKKAI